MGLFKFLNKKRKTQKNITNSIESKVGYVTDENGVKYLNIKDFTEFLREYGKEVKNPHQVEVILNIIGVLKEA